MTQFSGIDKVMFTCVYVHKAMERHLNGLKLTNLLNIVHASPFKLYFENMRNNYSKTDEVLRCNL